MSEAFPVEQFRDVFQVTPKIKNKLQPFIAEYKSLNMNWILSSLEELHRYFFDDKVDIMLKFNSIFGLKFLFDTAEVALVNLIEIYFLPRILDIASFDARGNEEKRGTAYFASIGYPKETPDIEKLSYNFVRLASEFVQVAATIKPKRLYLNEPIDDPSDYFEACQRLQEQGWKPYAKPAYYKDTIPAIAALFNKNLQAFDQAADPYIEFYTELFRVYLERGKAYQGRLNPKRVLESGDVYLTGPAIDLCAEFIRSASVKQRLQAMGLLSEFVRWGDIEAAYNINCTDLLDDILREVANMESGIVSLGRGKSMFLKLESSEQLKQELYVETLKAIQFWALCFPRALKLKNRDSKIKLAHDELRMKLKIEFPDDKNLKEHKMEFDRNFARKKKRNYTLLAEFENEDPEYVSFVYAKPSATLPKSANPKSTDSIPHKSESPPKAPEASPKLKQPNPPKTATKIEPPPKDIGDYARIQESIKEAAASLHSLLESEPAVPQKAQRLNKFKNQFEATVERADVNDDEFDDLLSKGSPILERLERILPHLNNYLAKKITFKELTEAVNPQAKSRLKQPPTESKEKIPPPASHQKPKPEPQKTEKKHQRLEETSLKVEKVEERPAERSSEREVPKTMPEVEKNSKSIKAIPEVRSQAEVPKHKVEESRAKPDKEPTEVKKVDLTPIKKMQEEELRQKFSEERSLASLPQVSKQSFSKSLEEEINIEPESHKILGEKEAVHLNLFKEVSRESASIAQKEHDWSRKNHQELEEEIEQDVEVNPPKSIENVKGSYRFKPDSSPIIRAPGGNKESRSRIDFEESKISNKAEPEDDDDLIMIPEINPLEVSYHDIGGFEEQLKENRELSFKKCFEADKYLLGPSKNTKMFWLEKETLSLIKPNAPRRSSRNKDSSISIPEILSEKDKKYQSELRYVEEQNLRKVRELEKKISSLQTEGKQLKLKIDEQDKEIKSYKAESSVSNSRLKKNLYLEDQDQLFRTRHAQKTTKERSFYEEPRIKESKCLEPQGKLISSRKYAEYFAAFAEEKRKKNLLKNKELLFKDDTIEFGCMSRREGDTLIVTFYVTPETDLEGLTYNLSPVANPSLALTVEPRNIASIRRKKQEKVIVSVKIESTPYHLPEIEFVYNLDGRMGSHKFTVPCAFHKFVQVGPCSERELAGRFQSIKDVIRGEEVPYSRKLLKSMEALSEYFPSGSLMRGGEPNENGEVEFGGKAEWRREKFYMKISIKPSQFLCVQAATDASSPAVEFYITLLTSLLMKNVELSDIK